jgi:hypothetical protein
MTARVRAYSPTARAALRSAIVFAFGLAGTAACGGSTFLAGDPTDAQPSDEAATSARSEDGAVDATGERGDDGSVPFDAEQRDGPADGGDAASDSERRADVVVDARPPDAASAYPSAVIADGPIAYWRMGVSLASVVPDESGHHNDLLLQGGGFAFGMAGAITGDVDRAIGFDGINSYGIALRPRDFDFPNGAPFTIECWARREPLAEGGAGEYFQQLVSASAGGPPNRNGYILYLLPADPNPMAIHTSFEYDAPDQGQIAIDGPLAPRSTYAHYVATFDGTKASLYVNGALASSRAVSGTIQARMSDFVVGREGVTGRYHFAGAIDEVAVYDKALSTLQVTMHRDVALRR